MKNEKIDTHTMHFDIKIENCLYRFWSSNDGTHWHLGCKDNYIWLFDKNDCKPDENLVFYYVKLLNF